MNTYVINNIGYIWFVMPWKIKLKQHHLDESRIRIAPSKLIILTLHCNKFVKDKIQTSFLSSDHVFIPITNIQSDILLRAQLINEYSNQRYVDKGYVYKTKNIEFVL